MLKVVVDVPYWSIRRNNTDWKYTRYAFSRLSEKIPVEFYYLKDTERFFLESLRFASDRIGSKIFGCDNEQSYCRERDTLAFMRGIDRISPDIIYSHDSVSTCSEVPILWHHAYVDPEMCESRGFDGETLLQLKNKHMEAAGKVSRILNNSDVQLKRHKETFDEFSGKYISAPFYMPHLPDTVSLKRFDFSKGSVKIKMLFVGREANRKGLKVVLDALNKIDYSRYELTVVSDFTDGYFDLSEYPFDIIYYESLSFYQVRELLAESHVFIMPSFFESYGFVFIEAMAAGCIIVAPDWEIQKEMVGGIGFCVKPNEKDVSCVLNSILDCSLAELNQMVEIATERYNDVYSPSVVSKNYLRIFEGMI